MADTLGWIITRYAQQLQQSQQTLHALKQELDDIQRDIHRIQRRIESTLDVEKFEDDPPPHIHSSPPPCPTTPEMIFVASAHMVPPPAPAMEVIRGPFVYVKGRPTYVAATRASLTGLVARVKHIVTRDLEDQGMIAPSIKRPVARRLDFDSIASDPPSPSVTEIQSSVADRVLYYDTRTTTFTTYIRLPSLMVPDTFHVIEISFKNEMGHDVSHVSHNFVDMDQPPHVFPSFVEEHNASAYVICLTI